MGNVTADQIREFANQHYIGPARAARKPQVTIRSGDVHAAMGLVSRMPAVCSAIGSEKFCRDYRLNLAGRLGPTNRANVYFTFDILP
jgi:5-methylcytosine-specific restriction enzyme B